MIECLFRRESYGRNGWTVESLARVNRRCVVFWGKVDIITDLDWLVLFVRRKQLPFLRYNCGTCKITYFITFECRRSITPALSSFFITGLVANQCYCTFHFQRLSSAIISFPANLVFSTFSEENISCSLIATVVVGTVVPTYGFFAQFPWKPPLSEDGYLDYLLIIRVLAMIGKWHKIKRLCSTPVFHLHELMLVNNIIIRILILFYFLTISVSFPLADQR